MDETFFTGVPKSTDHKPLQYFFAPGGEILKTASARISRFVTALMGFDYKLNYVPGAQIPHGRSEKAALGQQDARRGENLLP